MNTTSTSNRGNRRNGLRLDVGGHLRAAWVSKLHILYLCPLNKRGLVIRFHRGVQANIDGEHWCALLIGRSWERRFGRIFTLGRGRFRVGLTFSDNWRWL